MTGVSLGAHLPPPWGAGFRRGIGPGFFFDCDVSHSHTQRMTHKACAFIPQTREMSGFKFGGGCKHISNPYEGIRFTRPARVDKPAMPSTNGARMQPTRWKLRMFTEAGKHKCWMCSCHLTYEMATVDHIKPKSKGGTNHPTNFRLACYRCNQLRRDASLTKQQRRVIYGNQPAA